MCDINPTETVRKSMDQIKPEGKQDQCRGGNCRIRELQMVVFLMGSVTLIIKLARLNQSQSPLSLHFLGFHSTLTVGKLTYAELNGA